jgi:hypothetical protein
MEGEDKENKRGGHEEEEGEKEEGKGSIEISRIFGFCYSSPPFSWNVPAASSSFYLYDFGRIRYTIIRFEERKGSKEKKKVYTLLRHRYHLSGYYQSCLFTALSVIR